MSKTAQEWAEEYFRGTFGERGFRADGKSDLVERIIRPAMEQARREEREACAKIADDMAACGSREQEDRSFQIADAIRKRSDYDLPESEMEQIIMSAIAKIKPDTVPSTKALKKAIRKRGEG